MVLNIFRHYVDDYPRLWPKLVHICRRWRRIVFGSEEDLCLQLFCTYGTPVLKTLSCWPALPIVVEYGGTPELDPPALEDEPNIVWALRQTSRVKSVRITLTRSLSNKLSSIWGERFSTLEDLVLASQDNMESILPNYFFRAPRIRCLHLTRIAIHPQAGCRCYYASLVDIQLHDVSADGPSLETLAITLRGMIKLRSLLLHFLSVQGPQRDITPPYRDIYLPSLTRLDFRGTSQDLAFLVVKINAPHLQDIEIVFLNRPTNTYVPTYSSLIISSCLINPTRIGLQSPCHRVDILSSDPTVPRRLKLQVSFEQFGWELTSIMIPNILYCSRASLLRVEELHISAIQSWSVQDNTDFDHWLKVLYLFESIKWLYVAGNLWTDFVLASRRFQRQGATVRHHSVQKPGLSNIPFQEATKTRWFPGRLIAVQHDQAWVNNFSGRGTASVYSRDQQHPLTYLQ